MTLFYFVRNGSKVNKSLDYILSRNAARTLSVSSSVLQQKSYRLVIAGGGTGGTATANKFASKLGAGNVAIIEPKEDHFYQPMWTMVGAGLKSFQQSVRSQASQLPKGVDWIKDTVASFDPDNNSLTTTQGDTLKYDFLVVATGFDLRYDMVKGLEQALTSDPQVCSNYHRDYVLKTHPAIKNFEGGNAIFTMPSTPIKCAGAPQKIMYLADDLLRKLGKRDSGNVQFCTGLGVLFGVKKYADSLWNVCKSRGIEVNLQHNLVEVRSESREAVFAVGEDKKEVVKPYGFLHVTPPMLAPQPLRESALANAAGFCEVDNFSLQHVRYPNVFSVGDSSSMPTSKTAAAVAGQMRVLRKNLGNVLDGKPITDFKYDGYTSCPLVTSSSSCILAEFGYDGKVLETFPVNQGKERRSMYWLKAHVMPQIYFRMLTKGYWDGPRTWRKFMHLGLSD